MRGRLTDKQVRQAREPGILIDGDGLRLKIQRRADGSLRRSWLLRYTFDGAQREAGLGGLDQVGLAEARQRADKLRRLVRDKIDPVEAEKESRERRRAEKRELADRQLMTFQACAERYIESHKAGWKNPKHAAQWPSSLKTYAYPHIGTMPVAEIDRAAVIKTLEPIWNDKRETASRLRGRIEAILDWATVREYRSGDNPARWRGNLQHALPTHRIRAVRHHPAVPFDDIQTFMASLRACPGVSARCLEFLILTAARYSEAAGARWDEVDIPNRLWTVAADRMKGRRFRTTEHRVPLSKRAISILTARRDDREAEGLPCGPGDLVFESPLKRERQLSDQTLTKVLRRLGRAETVHGFRSTFRDWCGERTAFPREVAEAALHHVVGDRVEAAYRRGDSIEKRRRLMDAWSEYCASTSAGKLIDFGARAHKRGAVS